MEDSPRAKLSGSHYMDQTPETAVDTQTINTAERSETDIFEELERLCTSPGYVYAFAFISLVNNLVTYQATLRPDDLLPGYSHDRLIRTELCTLFGLMVKGPVSFEFQGEETTSAYVEKSVSLLEELHRSIERPMRAGLMAAMKDRAQERDPFTMGEFLREAIFYGAESAYLFQYTEMSLDKYRADNPWLVKNKRFAIEDAHAILLTILELLPQKIFAVLKSSDLRKSNRFALDCLALEPNQIAAQSKRAREIVDAVLEAFSVTNDERNVGFKSASDFNMVNAAPILRDRDGRVFVFHSMSLGEALYESPFFWMTQDKDYFYKFAQKNRGDFAENFCVRRLECVFGQERVNTNIELHDAKGNIIGEIDVLVQYGDRALFVQAKSKRLTVAARKGIDDKIKEDFQKSVQDAYDQGFSCAELALAGKCTLIKRDGTVLKSTVDIRHVYILCVLSDHYPALAFQARNMISLKSLEGVKSPFVMDLFFLDEATEMLSSPLYFLSYVDRRTGYHDRVSVSHEHIILAYHLKKNLWLEKATDFIHLTDDVAVELDIAMLSRRAGERGNKNPPGILTGMRGTVVARILKLIDGLDDPVTIDLGLMLLALSGDSVEQASDGIERVINRARRDGALHDFSMSLKDSAEGITVHCSNLPHEEGLRRLLSHCVKRKYLSNADSWFGVWLGPGKFEIRVDLILRYKWKKDAAVLDAIHSGNTLAPEPSSGVTMGNPLGLVNN